MPPRGSPHHCISPFEVFALQGAQALLDFDNNEKIHNLNDFTATVRSSKTTSVRVSS